MTTLRIIDAVFNRTAGQRRARPVFLALLGGLGLHGALFMWAMSSGPSLETWSAELAVRVHAELTRADVIELPKPPPPVDKPPPPPPPAPTPMPQVAAIKKAPSPARAGKIIAASPSAAVDLPTTSFVTGTAATYAGGVTSSTGKSETAVNGPVGDAEQAGPADRSSAVAVQETDWKCPWPREAESQQIDEQSVTIRVIVRADGTAESATALSDPGFGFAAAARACAMAARYAPAHDRSGRAVRSPSPPILVHFNR